MSSYIHIYSSKLVWWRSFVWEGTTSQLFCGYTHGIRKQPEHLCHLLLNAKLYPHTVLFLHRYDYEDTASMTISEPQLG